MKTYLKNLKVGDKICLVQNGINSSRVKAEDGYCRRGTATVSKVGRKYLYVELDSTGIEVVFIKGNSHNYSSGGYCPNYTIYESEDSYLLEVSTEEMYSTVRRAYFLEYWNIKELPLSQLERVNKILSEVHNDE